MLGFSPLTLLFPLLLAFLYPSFSSNNAIDIVSFPASGRGSLDLGRVLLVTAHPDDEAMFFAPTILAFSNADRAADSQLHVLCLSTGEMGGPVLQRTSEFHRSMDILGVDSSRRWVLDDAKLRDNITIAWEADAIVQAAQPILQDYRINTILTFDQKGVSSHPNHASILAGLARLLPSASSARELRLFTLVSVPLYQKYIGPVAALLAKVDLIVSQSFLTITDTLASLILSAMEVPPIQTPPNSAPVVVFVSGWQAWWNSIRAMRQHESQLLWFRWLYLGASRYMWTNEWVEVTKA
jgi:N-acetylglucosaminylphosphatidylinositol deacetylase